MVRSTKKKSTQSSLISLTISSQSLSHQPVSFVGEKQEVSPLLFSSPSLPFSHLPFFFLSELPTLPGLEVQGVGDLSLPLTQTEAERLAAVGTQPPSGNGFSSHSLFSFFQTPLFSSKKRVRGHLSDCNHTENLPQYFSSFLDRFLLLKRFSQILTSYPLFQEKKEKRKRRKKPQSNLIPHR